MTTLMDDLRYARRAFAKNPGFTALVLATLALGIGSVVAIFSIANGVLLRPLPFRDPDRLVRIGHVRPDTVVARPTFSPQDIEDLKAAHPGLASASAWTYFPGLSTASLTGAGEPERLPAANVDGAFFETLGMPAAAGRFLTADDDREGKNHVAVISTSLWKRRFGGDRSMIGRPLVLDGTPFEVVGVMPPGFEFPSAEVDLWMPLSNLGEDSTPHRREIRWLDVVGRLAPGATLPQARAGIEALYARLAQQYPDSNKGFEHALVVPLATAVTGDVRKPIALLLGAVSLVLLIGCVNVANLLLARASVRRREIAIRAALGAGRGRLVRQLLTESLLLSFTGGLLGLLLARWGIDGLMSFAGGHVPRASGIRMDSGVVLFAVLLSVATGIAFGLLPALAAARGSVRGALEGSGARGGTDSRAARSLRRGLVVGEITLAVALLVGAGLLVRSFWRLTHADPGLRAESVLTLSVVVPSDVYNAEKDGPYRARMLAALRALPGVAAAGLSKTLPLHGGGEPYPVLVEGRPDLEKYKAPGGAIIVSPGYFSALGIPILRGRDFTDSDIETEKTVLLVNRKLARTLWGDADPIGKGLVFGGKQRLEVIGVVGDVRQEGLGQTPFATMYVPMSIFPRGSLKFYLRTQGDPTALAASARAAIHRLDPNQAISDMQPLTEVVAETVAGPRFLTLLVGVFGAAALLLAAIGVYGVISFSVARRTREIGVRIALGADRAAVRRLVLREGMALALSGLALGLVAALALSRVLSSVLFETRTHDPVTLAVVGVLLLLVALLACAIPARRAANLDPQEALRVEV
ncbi:MAG TPA: ABC transporter permease [Thermoanaerobaculia bacterium]|jgi:predicted permease